MPERSSTGRKIRQWWNWLRLPHFRSDDYLAEWFEHADLGRLDLPPVKNSGSTGEVKIVWEHEDA